MAECLSKIYHQSTSFPLKMMKELFNTNEEKQGIVSILQSDSEIHKNTASLRRTLSADMSSKKWLFQHGLKKTASSHEFSFPITDSDSSSDGEDEEFELWNSSIHDQKKNKIESFNSILSQKTNNKDVAYVHPLVKKSKSSLSDKSLEMCTESLGSETGCDGFSSSYEVVEDIKTDTFSLKFDWNQNEFKPIQFNHKKSPPRSFPPPISCGSVRMQSRRDNGRLILEAVSSPSHNNFHADRKDGRLVLSLITTSYDQFQQSEELFEEEVKEEEEELLVKDDQMIERGLEIATEKVVKMSNSAINFHRLALMMNKSNGRIRNSPWPNEFNDGVQLKIQKEMEEDASKALKQSLPPLPKAATRRMSSPSTLTVAATATATAAASLNAYEYYWRSKPTTIQNSISQQQPIKNSTLMLKFPNNSMGNENQNQHVLVPWSKGCKVSRRSLLLREPCCIATT